MLRKLASSTSKRSADVVAAAAVTLVSCRTLTTSARNTTAPKAFLSPSPLPHSAGALLTPRRAVATSSSAEASGRGAALTDAEIIAASEWRSPQYEERLGFRGGDVITEERLKRHYYVLAKHFHPDTAAASTPGQGSQTAEAFHNVKEAYDAISATLKDGGGGGGGTSSSASGAGSNGDDFAGGFTYSDEARRRSQMRLLGETVMLFVAMTVLLIYVVSRHNKSRMQSRYLWHLVWIFFMIQLFPRLFAAALIFAAHSMYLVDNTTLKEQAAVSLVVERRKTECTVKLDGIRPASVPNVVVQVTTSGSSDAADEKNTVASTLTFDKGVTEFLLPVPTVRNATYHIKAVDEERKMVLVDRTISALL